MAMRAVDKSQVLEAVFAAVDEVNQQLPRVRRLDKSPDTVITGEEGRLDSLGLINLTVAVEQQVERQFGASVTLADGMAAAPEQNPFRTLGTLADHLLTVLEAKGNG